MVVPVGNDIFPFLHQNRNDPLRRLKTRAVQETRLALKERGQSLLKLDMNVQRPGQIPRTGTPGPVFLDRLPGGFLDARVGGQAMIVVGARHNDLPSLDLDHRPFVLLNGAEIRIVPGGFYLIGTSEAPTLLKEIDGFFRAG